MSFSTRHSSLATRHSSLVTLLLNPWFQIAFSTFCVAIAELFLKRGAAQAPKLAASVNWTGISGLGIPLVWIGILLMAISFVSWLYVLRFLPLSIAFPLSQFVHVLVPLFSWIFLGELISPRRWAGITLVVLGVFTIAKPVARLEEKL
ncbi:MAG: EamA family transporter [Verrucomicrobia bacterium]|nr:EamA family transporter [Verrucomicrobiota bacterium]